MKTTILSCTLGPLLFASTGLAAVFHPAQRDHAFLGLNASHLNSQKKTANPAVNPYGNNKCRCVGIDNLRGYFATQIDYHHVQYPLEVGASCKAWDQSYHPQCKENPPPTWCFEPWCYVDPCECDLDVSPKKTTSGRNYRNHAAYWSYSTCGAFDFYTSTVAADSCVAQKEYSACVANRKCGWDGKQCGDAEAMATCDSTKQMDPITYGREDCRCVGFHGHKNGVAVMYIDDTRQVAYDSNAGATCGAWEQKTHPDCLKAGPKPDFCHQKWCFVDPCKCSGGAPPRTVMKANGDLRFQGKTAYWSYDTCGSEDKWSSTMKGTYCVTQTTEAGCKSMKKCTWTGKQCLGKALAEICVEQKQTGVLGIEAFSSGKLFATPIAVAVLFLLSTLFWA